MLVLISEGTGEQTLVNWFTWKSGGSIQSNSIFLLKPTKVSSPVLRSQDLIIVMPFFLVLLRFALIKFKGWSAAQLASAAKSAHVTPLLFDLHWLPISSWIQCSHLLPHCLLYNSSILLWVASSLLTSLSLLSLRSSVFWGWARGPWERDPFNALVPSSGTLFLSLLGIPLHSLLLSQTPNPTSSLLHGLICHVLLFPTNPSL